MSRPLSSEEVNQAVLYLKRMPLKWLQVMFDQVMNGYEVLKAFPQFDEAINLNPMILKEMERRDKAHKKKKEIAERKARLKALKQETNEIEQARLSNPNWGAFQ